MLGWPVIAVARASRRNRASTSLLSVRCGWRTLSATRRPIQVSSASKTTPTPPSPIRRRSANFPPTTMPGRSARESSGYGSAGWVMGGDTLGYPEPGDEGDVVAQPVEGALRAEGAGVGEV